MSTIYQFEPLALNIFIINIPIPAMGQHGPTWANMGKITPFVST